MVSSGIPQPSNPDGSPSASHPSWTPHPQQGWSPDFIPKLAQDAVDTHRIHQILRITNPEAMTQSQALAKKEGIFVGISSGATFAGALKIAANVATRDIKSNKVHTQDSRKAPTPWRQTESGPAVHHGGLASHRRRS